MTSGAASKYRVFLAEGISLCIVSNVDLVGYLSVPEYLLMGSEYGCYELQASHSNHLDGIGGVLGLTFSSGKISEPVCFSPSNRGAR